MKFKLRGTNVIAIELLTDEKSFNVEEIKKFILEKKQLLRGARFIISVENKVLKEEEVKELSDFLHSMEELTFCGLKTNLKENRELCIKLNIPCDLSSMELEREKERAETEEVKFVRKTLRSGDKITSTGDLVVMGDVNPGAEIEAGGNVYVMGNLRGTVKAGIGKTSGEVRALFFQAPRLELCGKELIFDRNEKYINFRVKVKDGEIKLEPQNGKKGR
ncbi:septum site-determining protein MinC [Phorcysia thermohydrogeniphila]|uniref:Probable septum site-determining protein MinC n=1 Tax=Phorcysia thermohydrogeniphila TaxID=936138 RepID=A0A4R1GH35_9BACT|nr:septum site-determining protein MinC [Phorcysia thermohydrogeniphila]TCK05149.1 septum site-determining protein MinC [Phorcysia thermohydrogeniphila]